MGDNDQNAGATPAAAGATPVQTTPVSPAPATAPASAPPATGDPDALGDGGKRALEAERTARREADAKFSALQQEFDTLKAAGQTDQEKAIALARKEASEEVLTRVQSQVRMARVEAALVGAGVEPTLLDLAARADEFTKLKVTDDGSVTGLADAVKALKEARPALFKAPVAPGTADGGARGSGTGLTMEQIKGMTPDQINDRWEEVAAAMAASRT